MNLGDSFFDNDEARQPPTTEAETEEVARPAEGVDVDANEGIPQPDEGNDDHEDEAEVEETGDEPTDREDTLNPDHVDDALDGDGDQDIDAALEEGEGDEEGEGVGEELNNEEHDDDSKEDDSMAQENTPPKPIARLPSLFDAAPSGASSSFAARPVSSEGATAAQPSVVASPTGFPTTTSFSTFGGSSTFGAAVSANPFANNKSTSGPMFTNPFQSSPTTVSPFGSSAPPVRVEPVPAKTADKEGKPLASNIFSNPTQSPTSTSAFTSPTSNVVQQPVLPPQTHQAPSQPSPSKTQPSHSPASTGVIGASPSAAVEAQLKQQKDRHDSFVATLQATHKRELEGLQKDNIAMKQQLAAQVAQLSADEALKVSLTADRDEASKQAEELRAKLQSTIAYRDNLHTEISALRKSLADAHAHTFELKGQLSLSPKQLRVVEELSSRLGSWFEEFAAKSDAQLQECLAGFGAADVEGDDNSIPSAATRSIPKLRDYFAAKLVALAEQTQQFGSDLAEARAAAAAAEAETASLRVTLQTVSDQLAASVATDESQSAETEGKLTEALSQIKAFSAAAIDAGHSLVAANAATTVALEDKDALDRRFAELLAVKEQLSGDLAKEVHSHQLAVRGLQNKIDGAEVRHADEVSSLKQHISTLTELASEASAAAAELGRRVVNSTSAQDDAEMEASAGEPPTKAPRAERPSQSPASAAGQATEDEEDEVLAAEKLLSTKPAEYAQSADSAARSTNAKVAQLHELATSLGLAELGSKRDRDNSQQAAARPTIPTFAEASAFYVKGRDYIATVQKDNESLRTSLSKSLHANRRMKELEASRSKTVGTFAALHSEIEHLRADNKHVRDELAGTREENGVLTAQLVSTMLSGLRADAAKSVASPIAPLPPSNIETFSLFGQSPRLHPLPSPTTGPMVDSSATALQKAVMESLSTIRRCATEISVRNSSITTNPEVQQAAAHQLQSVKNETLRLTKHKEALLKLIEPRERRLASVTSQLVRLAAQGHDVAEGAARSTVSPPSAAAGATAPPPISPSKPVQQIIVRALAQPTKTHATNRMSSNFGYSENLEAAVALALGLAEEQHTLLFVPAPSPAVEATYSSALLASAKLAPQRSTLLTNTHRTPATYASRTATPPLLAIGDGAMLIDQLDLSAGMSNPSPFTAELLNKLGSISAENERLRAKVSGDEGGLPARRALEATTSSAHASEVQSLRQAATDKDHAIVALRTELAAAKRTAAVAMADATTSNAKATALKSLVGTLSDSTGYAFNACQTIATSRSSVAQDLSKLRSQALKAHLAAVVGKVDASDEGPVTGARSLSDVVASAQPLLKKMTNSFRQLADSGRIAADGQHLLLSGGMAQVVTKCDAAISKALTSGRSLAQEHALKVLKERVTNELLNDVEEAMEDLPEDTTVATEEANLEEKEENEDAATAAATVEDEPEAPPIDDAQPDREASPLAEAEAQPTEEVADPSLEEGDNAVADVFVAADAFDADDTTDAAEEPATENISEDTGAITQADDQPIVE